MSAAKGGWLLWLLSLARLAEANEKTRSVYVYDAENVESLGIGPNEAAAYRSFFAGSPFSDDADFDYPDYWIAKNLRGALAEHRDFEVVSNPNDALIVVVALWGYGLCAASNDSKLDLWEVKKQVVAFDQQCPLRERVYASLAKTERFRSRTSSITPGATDHFYLAEYSEMDWLFFHEHPSLTKGWLRPPNPQRRAFKDGAAAITVEEPGYGLQWPSIVVPYNVQREKWFLPWKKESLQGKTSMIAFVGTVEALADIDICPRCRNDVSSKAIRRSLVTNVRRKCQEEVRTCRIIALDEVIENAYSERDDPALMRKVKMDDIAKESIFCLVPRGDNASSRRLYYAIQALCIPVVVSDNFELPFASQLPWDDMILRLPENAVVNDKNASYVFDVLDQLTPDDIRQRQRALYTHRASLLWDNDGHTSLNAGAMAHLLVELQRKAVLVNTSRGQKKFRF